MTAAAGTEPGPLPNPALAFVAEGAGPFPPAGVGA
jgi:hypothetical protein